MFWNKTHVRAFRRDWADAIDLFIYADNQDGTHSICKTITVEKMSAAETALMPQAPLSLDRTSAQELMDSLWSCGVRPTEGEGSAGQSAAQQSHIKTLETINSRLLGLLERNQ